MPAHNPAEALRYTQAEFDECGQIGERDGYEKAVQDIDRLTGGDGEYVYCLGHDSTRHCPDAEAMKARIVARFEALQASPPPSPDVAGVVERLRSHAASWRRDDAHKAREGEMEAAIADEAATLLESLSADKARLPEDVIELVISARIVAYEDQSKEALRDLDKAVEAFSERVPWENEPIEENAQ